MPHTLTLFEMPKKYKRKNKFSDDDDDESDENEEDNPDAGIPPMTQLKFQDIELDQGYRLSLPPFYTEKQILDAYKGNDKFFPSQDEFLEMMEEEMSSPSSGKSWNPSNEDDEEDDDFDEDSLSEYDEDEDEDIEEDDEEEDDDDVSDHDNRHRPVKKQKIDTILEDCNEKTLENVQVDTPPAHHLLDEEDNETGDF